jgi:hypothetical protein
MLTLSHIFFRTLVLSLLTIHLPYHSYGSEEEERNISPTMFGESFDTRCPICDKSPTEVIIDTKDYYSFPKKDVLESMLKAQQDNLISAPIVRSFLQTMQESVVLFSQMTFCEDQMQIALDNLDDLFFTKINARHVYDDDYSGQKALINGIIRGFCRKFHA